MVALTADAPAPVYLLGLVVGVALLASQRPIIEFVDEGSREFYLDRLPRPLYLGWLWMFRIGVIVCGAGFVLVGVVGFVAALFVRCDGSSPRC